jgi:hypothetical protein
MKPAVEVGKIMKLAPAAQPYVKQGQLEALLHACTVPQIKHPQATGQSIPANLVRFLQP